MPTGGFNCNLFSGGCPALHCLKPSSPFPRQQYNVFAQIDDDDGEYKKSGLTGCAVQSATITFAASCGLRLTEAIAELKYVLQP